MPPKAKASKAAAAPLACVASVLQDEDLMAIVLEQGGLSIMAATSLSKSSVNTSTTSPKLSFACSTRGEDEGGRPQLTKPAAISEHNGLLFVGSKSKIVVLSVHDNGRGVRLERSMGGKGSALASLKPKSGCFPFTVHRDALYVIGEQHLGVLSLNGVLRQKIRIPVSSPIVTTICVDDKHAYIHLCASSGVLGGGRNASGLYILEKVQISVAGSSTA